MNPFFLLLVCVFSLGAVAPFPSSAGAGGIPVVAVPDFECESGSAQVCALAARASDRVTTRLAWFSDLQVVERSRLQKVLEEHKFSLSGLVDTSNVSIVGKFVSADYMVIGRVSKPGDKWAGHVRLVEIASGKIFFADDLEGADEESLLAAVQEKADRIAAKLRHIQKGSFILTFLAADKKTGNTRLNEKDRKRLLEVLSRKAANYGATGVEVKQSGQKVTLRVSGIADPLDLASALMQDDVLEFRPARMPASPGAGPPRGYKAYTGEESGGLTIFVSDKVEISGERISDSSVIVDWYGQPSVMVNFDKEGSRRLSAITGNNIGKPLAVMLNGKVLTAPIIRQRIIRGNIQISGRFDMETAFRLSLNLKSGKLPARISLEGVEKL